MAGNYTAANDCILPLQMIGSPRCARCRAHSRWVVRGRGEIDEIPECFYKGLGLHV